MNIVADPNIPFVREAFSALGTVTLVPGRAIRPEVVREADVLLVRSVTPVNAALLEGSRVRFVGTATIGTDHVDTAWLARRGIGFASAAGSNANSVAEFVVAALLELAHRKQFRLRGKTLGIVGVGNVGSRVARYAGALGMRLLQNDPPRQRAESLPHFVSLERVLAEADILTLHVPLTEAGPHPTFHLLDARRLGSLERRPILINTSRGAVVDNAALLGVLRAGRLAGAMLDVWEGEPNISRELLAAVDLGTPHIAGYSFDGKVEGTRMIYRAVCACFQHPATWDPTPFLPPPPLPRLQVSAAGRSEESVLREIVRQVYDITADDAALRSRPAEFDRLRAEYPVRREFFHTEVVCPDAPPALRQCLRTLGFRVPPDGE